MKKMIPKWIINMDWKSLQVDKDNMIEAIGNLDYDSTEANNAGFPEMATEYSKQANSVKNVVTLIATIEDWAIDELGIDKGAVFGSEINSRNAQENEK